MIPLSVSEKLLQLTGGEQLPASAVKHVIVDELIQEGIILERIAGRTKRTIFIAETGLFDVWLFNRFGINSLSEYIRVLKDEAAGRADLVRVGNDSKTLSRRTFKGFLINSYTTVQCTLNSEPFLFEPLAGTFRFIYDFEKFVPSTDVVIVGIENAENFRFAEKQAHLFGDIKPLFVCRYPQGKDLIRWLLSIPNAYLHFGDFDFAGINIYITEYKRHLRDRASFFVPANIEELMKKYGNRALYDQQKPGSVPITEPNIQQLIALINKYKMGLEQEALLIS